MRNIKKKLNTKDRPKTVILSVVLAVAVWITVAYLTDPDIKTTISDLDVSFSGEMMLKNKGLVVTEKSSIPPLSVVVSGKRSDLIEYLDKLYVEFDVSDITDSGEYYLSGTISLPSTKITVEREKYGDIPITVEKLKEKEIPIELVQTGTTKNKLVKSELLQENVIISGAESEINSVAGGVAEIDVSTVTQNNKVLLPYLLKDNNGNLIESNETIETTTAEIPVKNTIYERKTLPVALKLSQELEHEYILNKDKSTVSKTSIEVGVLSENHDDCVYAEISAYSDETSEYALTETDGMYIPESERLVKIKPNLTKKHQQSLELLVELINIPEGMTVRGDASIFASVYGAEDKLNTDNIRAYADLSGCGAGGHTLPVVIEGDTISVKGEYTIQIELN